MLRHRTAILLTLCILSFSVPMLAHHGTYASYDRDKTITLNGTVTQFQYAYPHILIFFDVKDETGHAVHWAAEMIESPGILKTKDAKWNRKTIQSGDQLTIACNPHKVPDTKVCIARELTLNGKKIY